MKIAQRQRKTRLKSRYSESDFSFSHRTQLSKNGLTKTVKGKRILTSKGERYLVDRFIRRHAKSLDDYKPLHSVLTSLFGSLKGKHILEIGPESSLPIHLLEKRGAVAKGLDSGSTPHEKLVRGSVEDLAHLFKSEKFDAIISRRVFESGGFQPKGQMARFDPTREQLSQIVNGMRQKLPKGGYLVIETGIPSFITIELLKSHGFVGVKRIEIMMDNETADDALSNILIAKKA